MHAGHRSLGTLLIGALLMSIQAAAAAGPKFFAYNNTASTDFKGLYLAPAGTESWGPNQALNDKDKSLDASERLTLTGVSPGGYNVKLVTTDGRTCLLKNIDLTKDNSFDIRDAQLTDCH